MKTKLTVILLCGLTISTNVWAQSTSQSLIDTFFSDYQNSGADVAVTKLYATNPWTSRIQDQIDNVKAQLSRYDKDLVGEYYGYEKIVTRSISNSFELHAYFMKYDRQFLRVTFMFYNPNGKWRLYSFSFDSSYDDELEEAAKVYNLELGQ
jgi:S-methylmethionine-dependent homocysteine/selenocysteine methylase